MLYIYVTGEGHPNLVALHTKLSSGGENFVSGSHGKSFGLSLKVKTEGVRVVQRSPKTKKKASYMYIWGTRLILATFQHLDLVRPLEGRWGH
jgi:hypothetical protein